MFLSRFVARPIPATPREPQCILRSSKTQIFREKPIKLKIPQTDPIEMTLVIDQLNWIVNLWPERLKMPLNGNNQSVGMMCGKVFPKYVMVKN